MISPADAIHAYLRAKDGNRPHLMAQAFALDAQLTMQVNTGAIAFPPQVSGREGIADILVRQFGRSYDNVSTFCLAPPPAQVRAFSCDWLVTMTDKQDGSARVGCGRYDWYFAVDTGLVERLRIVIEVMLVLPATAAAPVLDWAAALPYPWRAADLALAGAGGIEGLEPVRAWLAFNNRFAHPRPDLFASVRRVC